MNLVKMVRKKISNFEGEDRFGVEVGVFLFHFHDGICAFPAGFILEIA